MANNPKLEFYRFTLNHKEEKIKTFRDFAIEELGGKENMSNEDIFKLCYKHFIKQFSEGHAQSKKKKKTITIIADPEKNPFLSQKPSPDISNNILSGVVNGGFYDKEAIVSSIVDKEDSSVLEKNKAVLFPYFIFAYLPADHFEGFFIVHANSREDTITDIVRSYITSVFSGVKYNKAKATPFCPKSFQKEYRKGAVLRDILFQTTIIENTLTNDPFKCVPQGYRLEIKISQIKTKNNAKKISVADSKSIFDFFRKGAYKKETGKIDIDDFESKKVVVEKEKGKKHPRTFNWDNLGGDFIPVVDIEDQGIQIIDGLPEFAELKMYCKKLFEEEIIKEIRPDLYVTKAM